MLHLLKKSTSIHNDYPGQAGSDGSSQAFGKFNAGNNAEKEQLADLRGQMEAIHKSQAVIEFKPDGTIITANANFLNALGYKLEDIQGQHHRMFVDPAEAARPSYSQFWEALQRGEYQAGEFKRIGKSGTEVWIQASYNSIMDLDGKVYKVVKFATDVTAAKIKNADYAGQLDAISKSQAIIEFNMDGTIITANENFLNTLGYKLDEIMGKHHRIFVDPAEAAMPAYSEFWASLAEGKYQAAQYRRIGKNGKEVWIQASYNPIMDLGGKAYKVVKYATDITTQTEVITAIVGSIDAIRAAITTVNEQASSASAGSQQTASNVQAVAAGAEELHASVQEIAESMQKSRDEVDSAVSKLNDSNAETQKLAAAAQAMNGIVKLIQHIAAQVRLLSLNATIEAARAGEAGKGFAVVATEVKNLAQQAAEATQRIEVEISGVQAVVKVVVEQLADISAGMENVSNYVTGTAGAIEEQSAVTKEMSSNMQFASAAVQEGSKSIGDIVSAVSTVKLELDKTSTQAARLS